MFAMTVAAERGHLGVVQFLHEERKERFAKYNVDGAAKGGFLEVVAYLMREKIERMPAKKVGHEIMGPI